MRYFARCRYNGTKLHGWQAQKGTEATIQGQIEKALNVFLPQKIAIVGCGRTDAGVHASEYYFHFDHEEYDVDLMKYKANSILPFVIFINEIFAVHDDAHARYDAQLRAYEYHLVGERDPFREHTTTVYPTLHKLSLDDLNRAADILLEFESFEPFCKKGSDEKHKLCTMYRSEWVPTQNGYIYHVESNRFLRGMIRLIVGMCINVARGKVALVEVEKALKDQSRLNIDWSVSANGLYLSKVEYPYLKNGIYTPDN